MTDTQAVEMLEHLAALEAAAQYDSVPIGAALMAVVGLLALIAGLLLWLIALRAGGL